jgi:putative two-component system response regulator
MNDPTRLLIIDDDKALLLGLAETIKRGGQYEIFAADNGNLGIKMAEENLPHLIICDLMMPPPNGLAVLKALSGKPMTAGIPFIFLTARTSENDKVDGMNWGADDYITKPFSGEELLARVNAILRRKEMTEIQERLKSEAEFRDLILRIQELIQFFQHDQKALAEALAQVLSLRDSETEEHSRRALDLSEKLARMLGISEEQRHQIHLGTLLHDIGKIGIPDSILLKEGILSNQERQVMMTHSTLGKRILKPLGLSPTVIDITYYHHERWDGSGYPDGLTGENIPLPARIFAIIDVWDALTSDRPYRKAWSMDEALSYITEHAGKHFDPDIVQKFLIIIQRERERR